MAFTTGRTTAQMAAVLVTAGALPDQALGVLHSGGWAKNVPQELWGVLVQCTSGWNDGGDSVWEYDTSPSYTHTGQTFAQAQAALVAAGALTDQAQHTLGGLAWTPNIPVIHWNTLIKCTSGWNATTGPVFSYTTSPS
jgi:hypothetical protein